MKYSPIPWKKIFAGEVIDKNGKLITITVDENEANAQRICQCVNSHDELLEFAKEMAFRYPNSPWIYKKANKIIKKATEG